VSWLSVKIDALQMSRPTILDLAKERTPQPQKTSSFNHICAEMIQPGSIA
jgi:hypothetical protein